MRGTEILNHRTPILQSYLQLTAYSVISASSVRGTCVKGTGSPIPLPDPYIFYIQSYDQWIGSYDDLLLAISSSLSNAYSSLKNDTGYERCTTATTVPTSLVLPLGSPSTIKQVASATALPLAPAVPSATSTQRSVHDQHVRTGLIIVSVVVPVAVLIGVSLCFVGIGRYRKRKRSQPDGKDQRSLTSNSQIYVDRKAELEDEERRKHELDASGVSYEIDGEDKIFEMPTWDRDSGTRSASLREIHELRDVEHSQELEVPGNAT